MNHIPQKWKEYIRWRNDTKLVTGEVKKKSWEEFGKCLDWDYRENVKKF